MQQPAFTMNVYMSNVMERGVVPIFAVCGVVCQFEIEGVDDEVGNVKKED